MNKILEIAQNGEILEALDMLDLDEYLIDEKLDKLMKKSTLQCNHLKTMLTFLKYKYMICLQEETDCDNDVYIDFVIKLLLACPTENTDILLAILSVSLSLNPEKLQSVVEHLLQQLMTLDDQHSSELSEGLPPIQFRIINNILELCVQSNITIHSSFLNNEIEKLIETQEKLISTQFFSKTIPLIINGCQDYSVLNMIWDRILSRLNHFNKNDFIILSTLSEFYLPLSTDHTFNRIESTILETYELWRLLYCGFLDEDYSVRKCSMYLARRAIHCAAEKKISVSQPGDKVPIFYWNKQKKTTLESSWFALFTLLETLEEKQAHLVLSALKLFDNLNALHFSWYNCALIRAFSHDANSVVQHSLEIALRNNSNDLSTDSFPFKQLISALNNVFLYEHIFNYEKNHIFPLFITFLEHGNNVNNMVLSLPSINLSPIPIFYISYALTLVSNCGNGSLPLKKIIEGFFGVNTPILNNALIRCATECCFLNFILNNSTTVLKPEHLFDVFSAFSTNKLLTRDNIFWNKFKAFINKYKFESEISQKVLSMMDVSYLKNMIDVKPLVLLVVLLNDSKLINHSFIIENLKVMIKSLRDSQNREYSSNTEFDGYFFFIVNITDIILFKRGSDQLKIDFLNLLDTIAHTLVNYLQTRMRTFFKFDELNLINQYIVGLDILTNKAHTESVNIPMESLFNVAECILKTEEINFPQKYFALKVLSRAVTYFLACNENINNKQELSNRMFELMQNTIMFKIDDSEISKGKMISDFNQAKIQIYIEYYSCLNEWSPDRVNVLLEEVMDLLETGGHGCLLLIIHLARLLLQKLLIAERLHDIEIVTRRIWRDTFELRKNDQFKICFKAFIKMLYQKDNISSPLLQSIMLEYGDTIFELGDQIPFVVHELMEHISYVSRNIINFSFILLLSKALLFGVVLRKDQRIEYECCDFITHQHKDFLIPDEVQYVVNPIPQIRSAVLEILKMQNVEVHAQILLDLRNKVDIICKPNNRYHGNSLQHRFLLRTLQGLLFSLKFQPDGNHVEDNVHWCLQRLVKQPHHISSRILLEWYIALYIIKKNLPLDSDIIKELHLSEMPQLSYFTVIYHVLKHQIVTTLNEPNQLRTELPYDNFNFAMQTYLPYTMGQLFSIRLHAQYFTLSLNQLMKCDPICEKYSIICDTILNTFDLSSGEKNLIKIKKDFYINHFDVTAGLSVNNIYHNIPRHTGVAQDEWVFSTASNEIEYETNFTNSIDSESNYDIAKAESDLTKHSKNTILEQQASEAHINIQKKFVPWKNMLAELGITSENEQDRKSTSGLIVVASLIDRLPNLGGLARTCEVFGVKQYVIDSLRHLQDKQFQTLSVSSERWINVIEVTPGIALKNYLIEMKTKGYIIVGAEQTSSSVVLNSFTFPKNTLLLLGHEKEGIPCNLLSLMDYCVEIPQHGLVRSLNVHVTASIFIWEYTKQHVVE